MFLLCFIDKNIKEGYYVISGQLFWIPIPLPEGSDRYDALSYYRHEGYRFEHRSPPQDPGLFRPGAAEAAGLHGSSGHLQVAVGQDPSQHRQSRHSQLHIRSTH